MNFLILDAARIFGEIETAQKLQSNFLNLFKGKDEEDLESVAPYLFVYVPASEFGSWLMERGWGNSWGIFLEANESIESLRQHLRKFLVVKPVDGGDAYFRFYDPRVLRTYLPACDEKQLQEFFGPVKSFGMEDENPEFAIEFELLGGKLVKRKKTKEAFWNTLNGGPDSATENSGISETAGFNEKEKPGRKWNFFIE